MPAISQVLAFAVNSEGAATVFLVDGRLKDWRRWRRDISAGPLTRSKLLLTLYELEPDAVVTEDPDNGCNKWGQSLTVLRTLVQAVEDEPVRVIHVRPTLRHRNRHEEAYALLLRFPQIDTQTPKARTAYDIDPRNLLFFEALSYAVAIIDADLPQ